VITLSHAIFAEIRKVTVASGLVPGGHGDNPWDPEKAKNKGAARQRFSYFHGFSQLVQQDEAVVINDACRPIRGGNAVLILVRQIAITSPLARFILRFSETGEAKA